MNLNKCYLVFALSINMIRSCLLQYGYSFESETNGCLELYLKGLSIGFACRPFVGFKAIRRRICVDQGYSWSYPKIGHVDQD